MLSLDAAEARLHRAFTKRNKGVTVVRHTDAVAVYYHATAIVIYREGRVTLNSGGWRPPHKSGHYTKERINRALDALDSPVRVAQKRKAWVWYRFDDADAGERLYQDGDVIQLAA